MKSQRRFLKKNSLAARLAYWNDYFNDQWGIQASLVFHYTGIDVTMLDNDAAAKYMAMNRRAMLALKLMEEKGQQANEIRNTGNE